MLRDSKRWPTVVGGPNVTKLSLGRSKVPLIASHKVNDYSVFFEPKTSCNLHSQSPNIDAMSHFGGL